MVAFEFPVAGTIPKSGRRDVLRRARARHARGIFSMAIKGFITVDGDFYTDHFFPETFHFVDFDTDATEGIIWFFCIWRWFRHPVKFGIIFSSPIFLKTGTQGFLTKLISNLIMVFQSLAYSSSQCKCDCKCRCDSNCITFYITFGFYTLFSSLNK